MSSAQRAMLVAIVVAAAALRIWWNDVERYSPADEAVYSGVTRHLIDRGFIGGYPDVVKSFLTEHRLQSFPTPFRYGYFALTRLTAAIYGAPEPHALAWLSTIAGILVVPLLFVLGRRLFGTRTALLAAAFAAFSCIELALGRRALQDEVFCLAVLLAVTLSIFALEAETPSMLAIAGAIAAMTFAFAVKETFVLLYPALIAAAVILRRRDPSPYARLTAVFALPPLLWFLGFCALSRDFGSFFRAARIAASAGSAPYALAYQSGPPHRPLFDLFLTAPLVSMLATAAVALVALGHNQGKRERAVIVFLVLAIAAFGIAPSKNLRFVVVVDPFIRLAAAWLVATLARGSVPLVAFGAASAAIELELFTAIFIKGGVYDPVTQTMLEALAAVPRDDVHPVTLIFPWLCAAIAAAAWIASRRHAGHAPK
jgi:4-amino-4-deoxy-L-arabinose transferase-like glycosyltransferase